MEYIELGRTGLSVSVAGLGCGGHSRLGMATGHDENHAADVVRHPIVGRIVDAYEGPNA